VFLRQAEALPRFDHAFRDWLHGLTPPAFERRKRRGRDVSSGSSSAAPPLPPSGPKPVKAADRRRRMPTVPAQSGSSVRPRGARTARMGGAASRAPCRAPARRRVAARQGAIDLAAMPAPGHAFAGEFKPLSRRGRPETPRRLLMLIDVSGSMKAARSTRCAWRTRWSRPAATEIFCFGTR